MMEQFNRNSISRIRSKWYLLTVSCCHFSSFVLAMCSKKKHTKWKRFSFWKEERIWSSLAQCLLICFSQSSLKTVRAMVGREELVTESIQTSNSQNLWGGHLQHCTNVVSQENWNEGLNLSPYTRSWVAGKGSSSSWDLTPQLQL